MLFGIFIMVILAFFNAAPLAFFSMLFFGNVGWNIGFLGVLPGAIAVYCIKNSIFGFTKIKGK